MTELTDTQRRVLEFVRSKLQAGASAPTFREITAQFGWKSHRAAACHVEAIRRKGWLVSDPGKNRSLRLARPLAPTAEIPLFGTIPAGFGQERAQESDACIRVDVATLGFKPTQKTFALRVVGDSMLGVHICDGDIAVFEHGAEPRSGQIVAALIDGKSTLKTFVLKNRKPFLRAENPKYPNLIPSEELVIQGVLRTLIRQASA